MTKSKKLYLVPSLVAILLLIIFQTTITAENSTPSVTQCPSSIFVSKPSPQSTTASSIVLEVTTPVSNYINISQVRLLLRDSVVGKASRVSSSSGIWQLPFDSKTFPNGDYKLTADVDFRKSTTAGGIADTQTCRTPGIYFKVYNPTASPQPAPVPVNTDTTSTTPLVTSVTGIKTSSSATSWSGPTKVAMRFSLSTKAAYSDGTSKDVTDLAAYQIETTLGAVSLKDGHFVEFFSGDRAGDGDLTIKALYSGKVFILHIPLHITAAETSTSYPEPSAQAASQPTGDVELRKCLSTNEGTKNLVITDTLRLSSAQIDSADSCFAQRHNVIPSNLAPINPSSVRSLPEASDILKISGKEQKSKDGKAAIEFSGTSKPNQRVFIYIFSEPLVLTAKSNAEGNWSYLLEDPIESGTHDAFVAVEGNTAGAGQRSGAFGFAIASTTPTGDNPLGLSLQLQSEASPSRFITVYVLGASSLVFGALAIILMIVRRQQIKHVA